MYVCTELINNECQNWVSLFEATLTYNEAIYLGFMFLALTGLAWGISLIVKLMLDPVR